MPKTFSPEQQPIIDRLVKDALNELRSGKKLYHSVVAETLAKVAALPSSDKRPDTEQLAEGYRWMADEHLEPVPSKGQQRN